MADSIFRVVVDFLVGRSPFSMENQAFWMAVQGSMNVRKGPNKDKHMQWFHALTLSVLAGFAGGWLGFVWLGKPSSMLSNDLNMAGCLLAFVVVNYMPWDLGFMALDTLPFRVVTVSFAQLFRATGLIRFVNVCFETFKGAPSAYYPIPVFGPILYGTLLGNMAGFLSKGVDGYVLDGMPWPFQNGIFCASFYHFFVNDQTGPIGAMLRAAFPKAVRMGLDEATFAAAFVSLFMQVMGLLQMPDFFGPSYSPFVIEKLRSWQKASSVSASSSKQNSSAYNDAREKAKQAVANKKKVKKT